jgi:hypothetical protein
MGMHAADQGFGRDWPQGVTLSPKERTGRSLHPRGSLRNLPKRLVRFGESVCGDAAGDVERSVLGDRYAELQQFVDAPLVLWRGVGEVASGVSGEVLECFELRSIGGGALLPEV